MRHHNANRKFGRVAKQRDALLRALASSLIIHEKIKTTEAKAKEVRPFVEKLITKGKNDTVASRRLIISRLGSEQVAEKLVKDISARYKERSGGYTRIVKLPKRISDASPMAIIELV
jgi:large subunit ribosomal protein L17